MFMHTKSNNLFRLTEAIHAFQVFILSVQVMLAVQLLPAW